MSKSALVIKDGHLVRVHDDGHESFMSIDERAKLIKATKMLPYAPAITIDLSVAHDKTEIKVIGDSMLVSAITGTASIIYNEPDNPSLSLNTERGATFRYEAAFYRIFISNSAQPGKSCRLIAGKGVEFSPFNGLLQAVKIGDKNGIDISPMQDNIIGIATSSVGYVSTTSRILIATNPTRAHLLITALAGAVYLNEGAAAVLNSGIPLLNWSASYEMTRQNLYQGAVYAIAPTVGSAISGLAGTHTGANHATVMTDAAITLVADSLIGLMIKNVTDGSQGIITTNGIHTITVAALSGGVANTWVTTNAYTVNGHAVAIKESNLL